MTSSRKSFFGRLSPGSFNLLGSVILRGSVDLQDSVNLQGSVDLANGTPVVPQLIPLSASVLLSVCGALAPSVFAAQLLLPSECRADESGRATAVVLNIPYGANGGGETTAEAQEQGSHGNAPIRISPSPASHAIHGRGMRSATESRLGSFQSSLSQKLSPLRERFAHNLSVLEENLLSYRRPTISGNYRLQSDEILAAAGMQGKNWIWERSPEEIRERIEELPWIEKADLRVGIFPSSLNITVKEAEPWLVAEYEGSSWLVSREGELLQTLSSIQDPDLVIEVGDLPRLDGLESQPAVESYLASANARFVYAAKLVKFIEMAGEVPFPYDRITLLRTGGLKITPIDRERHPEVLLAATSLEEAGDALQRLSLVLGDLDARKERARQIDLRFNNQAILR